MASRLVTWITVKSKLKSFPLNSGILRRRNFFSFRKSPESLRKGKGRKLFSDIMAIGLGIVSYELADYLGLSRKISSMPIFGRKLNNARKDYNFISDIFELAGPSVVYIEVIELSPNVGENRHYRVSTGSGFIVESNGLIVTSAHVILRAISKKYTSRIFVKLQNGKEYNAEVENVDTEANLATLRIQCNDLPTLLLGKSTDLKPGEFVLTLGSPLAFTNTVTYGIVSAHRKFTDNNQMTSNRIVYLQTDTTIHEGNAGGPLMNIDGQVVGVNSMNMVPGISFATPVNTLLNFLEECQRKNKRLNVLEINKRFRFVGICMVTLTEELLARLRLAHHKLPGNIRFGAYIHSVAENSPAELSGLIAGDVITHVNGSEVKASSDITHLLTDGRTKVLHMTVYRGIQLLKITVTPTE